ncbi:MAG: ferredoxin--NADP reductase [Sphingobacteriia bacterium]|nr:ferredoxin--NADP reductase [Sphingobacteriia bacterium]
MSIHQIDLIIDRIQALTPDASRIDLIRPDRKPVPFIPGQFLTFLFDIEGEKIRRSYSICSCSQDSPIISVGVKRVPGGKVSNYMLDTLQPGQTLSVVEPTGNFTFKPKSGVPEYVILFGAGSGITPLFSILKSALQESPLVKIALVYANESEETVMFSAELKELVATYPDRFRWIEILNHPKSFCNYTGLINNTLVLHLLGELYLPEFPSPEYYLCGPTGFMDVVLQALADGGIPKAKIHKETFSAIPPASGEGATEPLQEREVTVIYNDENYKFSVLPTESVLFSALDKNIDLPYSCQGGVCTACRGKLLSGKMHLDEREGLSDAEIADGYVLTCVGHPLTEDVVIEIG